jgi:hypothetical protein
MDHAHPIWLAGKLIVTAPADGAVLLIARKSVKRESGVAIVLNVIVATWTQVSPFPDNVGRSGVVVLLLTIQARTSWLALGVIETVGYELVLLVLLFVTRAVAVIATHPTRRLMDCQPLAHLATAHPH